MNFKYNSRIDFVNDFVAFVEKSCDENSNIGYRMVCGRLYYALYHKVLYDNNFTSKSGSMHSYIQGNITAKNLQNHYLMFYSLRQWADYDVNELALEYRKGKNLISLCKFLLGKQLKCQSLSR